MKLLITQNVVVAGGKVKERGEIYDTGAVARKEDKEAHQLISNGRALDNNTERAEVMRKEIATEKANKTKAKVAA